MPRCKKCEYYYTELIDDQCHECTAMELKKCKDACLLFVEWCKTPDVIVTPEVIEAIHEAAGFYEPKEIQNEKADT